MDPEFAQLVHTLTELTKVEAFYRDHSEGSCEVGKDSLRIAQETCQTALIRVQIRLADTVVFMFHFRDFILADTSAQGKRGNAGIDNDNGIDGGADKSVDPKTQTSTKDGVIQGDASQSIGQETPTSTKDGDIHGDANKSIEQPAAQEQDPISTEDHGNQREAYVSIFGDGPLYPHCVETWEAANAKAQQISRSDVTPMTNVRKYW